MATKKLKLEVELDTAKAKRQAKALEKSGGSSATGGTMSNEADGAARSLKGLSNAASETNINMKRATRAFAGIAVGLASSYAAGHMREGSTGRTALEYAGSAVTGASMGAMVGGPVDGAIGGLAGVLKTYLDRTALQNNMSREYARGEHDYEEDRAWKSFLRDLTDTGDNFEKLEEKIAAAKNRLEELKVAEEKAKKNMESFNKKGDKESAAIQQGYLNGSRAWQSQLEDFVYNGEKQLSKRQEYRVASYGAGDALSKIGGYATGGGIGIHGQNIQRSLDKQTELLGIIADNSKKGAVLT